MKLERRAFGRGLFKLQLSIVIFFCVVSQAEPIPGFKSLNQPGEQFFQDKSDDVRIVINASADFDPQKSTQLVIYALPNGNSIEQTIGAAEQQGRDWHFFIQQIGAQTRALRASDSEQNWVVAYVEANVPGVGKTWPVWKQRRDDHPARIRKIVDSILTRIPGKTSVILAAHSGGGGFISGYINSADTIDDRIVRIAYLDANYSYEDDEHHGDKLLKWLQADKQRHLIVVAYDDRNITLDGKPVVSPTGGTWRASYRMLDRFKKDIQLDQSTFGDDFDTFSGLAGQIRFFLHRNAKNAILHTRLVGEMNGFMTALTIGTPREVQLGKVGGIPKFADQIAREPIALSAASSQPSTSTAHREAGESKIPPRRADAITGSAFIQHVSTMPRDQREEQILDQVKAGNIPSWMRTFQTIHVKFTGTDGVPHLAEYRVTPDYVAIGSDDDFIRMPMLPATAERIADQLDCSLPTRKMVDDIDANAALRLEPQPMTEAREAPATFLEHHRLIETQRAGRATGQIICGTKKDIVLTNRLKEKPHRVAIYGWRKLDGEPIQPLTIVHGDTYVDYSHGVRLVAQQMLIDGNPTTVDAALRDPALCGLLSDEGPMSAAYR